MEKLDKILFEYSKKLPTTNQQYRSFFFSKDRNIYELSITSTNNKNLAITRTKMQIFNILGMHNDFQKLECPYYQLNFNAPKGKDFLRIPNLSGEAEAFPRNIFLDRNEIYEFGVEILPSMGLAKIEDLSLVFHQSYPPTIIIDATRTIDYLNNRVRYKVRLIDGGSSLPKKTKPGEIFETSSIQIQVKDSNYACVDHFYDSDHFYTSTYVMSVHSGCKPFQKLVPVITSVYCPDGEVSVPCLFFKELFSPKFVVRDELTGLDYAYKGDYVLQITADGASLGAISKHDSTKREMVNPKSSGEITNSMIWVPFSNTDNGAATHSSESSTLHKRSSASGAHPPSTVLQNEKVVSAYAVQNYHSAKIFWLCNPGSPCGLIFPESGSSSSKWYFNFSIDTSVDSSSYCLFETEFTAQVYGIDLSFAISLTLTILVFAGFMFGTMATIWTYKRIEEKREQREEQERLLKFEGMGFDEDGW